MNAKPKLMRRDAYEKMQLTSDGWFIDAEIMIETLRHKMLIAEIPTEFRRLHRRASFVSLGGRVRVPDKPHSLSLSGVLSPTVMKESA